MRFRWRKVKEVLVIRADVDFEVFTQDMAEGLYHSTIICPCSRRHTLVHYKPALDEEAP